MSLPDRAPTCANCGGPVRSEADLRYPAEDDGTYLGVCPGCAPDLAHNGEWPRVTA